MGAPMVEMGTFPAMDQGTRAAMRTTVSSRARARFSLSGSASFVSWSVRMIARVWLKAVSYTHLDVYKRQLQCTEHQPGSG